MSALPSARRQIFSELPMLTTSVSPNSDSILAISLSTNSPRWLRLATTRTALCPLLNRGADISWSSPSGFTFQAPVPT